MDIGTKKTTPLRYLNTSVKEEPRTGPVTCLVLPRGYKVIYQCSCCNLQFVDHTFYKNHIEKCRVAKQQELEQSYVDRVLEKEFSSEQSEDFKQQPQKKKIVISVHKGNPQYAVRRLEDSNVEPKKKVCKKRNSEASTIKKEMETKVYNYLIKDTKDRIEFTIQDISSETVDEESTQNSCLYTDTKSPENVEESTQSNSLLTDKKSEFIEVAKVNSEIIETIKPPGKRKKVSESSLEPKQSCETKGGKKKRNFLERIVEIAPIKAKEEVQNEDQKVYEFHDAEMEARKMQAKLAIANKNKTCPYCKILFDDPMDVLRHKREVHYFQKKYVPAAELEKFYEIEDMSKCPICNRTIRGGYKSNYINHLITHKEEYSYQCTICKMMFRRKDHKEIHEARHIL